VRRAVLAVLSFYLLGFLLSALVLLPFAGRLTGGRTSAELAAHPPPVFALAQGLALLLAFGAATWVVGLRALKLDAATLRWRTRLPWLTGLGIGLVFGLLPAAVAMMMGVFTAGAGWVHDGGSLGGWIGEVGKTLLILAPAALAEELMFRGLPLVLAARVLGRGRAILLLSLLFALAHLSNPDVTAAGIGNIALAGIFLSLAFYSAGGMWTAFGAHLGWNATLAALAAPVSGLPFDIPYIDYRMGSPVWLTGGAFGPEGGLLATATLAATVVLMAQWNRKEPT
jgi:membrane protease YdiL (CAAX protease family)